MVSLLESVAVMVKEKGLPVVVVGVPVRAPVLASKAIPVGRIPRVTA